MVLREAYTVNSGCYSQVLLHLKQQLIDLLHLLLSPATLTISKEDDAELSTFFRFSLDSLHNLI